ncbi:MAG: 50S ribosomal protein L29 [Chloroflexi bacterium]|nr:50S ribosomal protein L29 [Chloroflexota bacterium]
MVAKKTAEELTKYRAMTDMEVPKELEDARKELFNLRFRFATRQLADVSQIRKTHRKIARLQTILRQRAQASQTPSPAPESKTQG